MPQARIVHLVFMSDPKNADFYQDLFSFLGWSVMYRGDDMLGLVGPDDFSVWFGRPLNAAVNDHDGPGLNHLALGVPAQSDVDDMVAYLQRKGVPALFETPRHRPEFAGAEDQTYYQVMFESPDRILFEVVYSGPKQ